MNPPIDFLLVCSSVSLRDFELNRLNQAANIRKDLLKLQDELRQVEAEAVFARWLIEHRESMLAVGRAMAFQRSFEFDAGSARSTMALSPAGIPKKRSSPARKEICA